MHYQVGSSLPPNAPSYVVRQADQDFYRGLRAGEFCYVINSRQMGKSSLRVRTMQRLQAEGIACAVIDITLIGSQQVTLDQWYATLVTNLADSFQIPFNLSTWWDERELLPPVRRFSKFIEDVLLTAVTQNIVIFVDEIDSVLSLDFPTDDFFAFIRACYNQGANKPEYERLTFALLGVAAPSDLIQDKKRTPFNIGGQAIQLYGFQLKEAEPLARGLKARVSNPQAVLKEVLSWTGGQPFLTQKLCQLVLTSSPIPAGCEAEYVENLVRSQVIENWKSQDEPQHLKTISDRILWSEKGAVRLLGLYQQILQLGEVAADGSHEQMELRLSGLVVEQKSKLRVYNRIYQSVFNQNWVAQMLAEQRPYANQFRTWLDSNYQDKSQLLRGRELREVLTWAKDKKLTSGDEKFLRASQEAENKIFRIVSKSIYSVVLVGISGLVLWLKTTPYIFNPERFSQGERTFFISDENYGQIRGTEEFKKHRFSNAEALFKMAVEANPHDPEMLIYKNNARAFIQGNPLTLAVAVPLDKKKSFATNVLKGVALAQDEFNAEQEELNRKKGFPHRLLNIVIAKDNDDPQQAKEVARELIKDKNVLGVIGHVTSDSTKNALPEYEKANMAIVSPTSTSTDLKSEVFFRTVPSDKIMAKNLVNYAIKNHIYRVIIFYKSGAYGDSFKKAFTDSFKRKNGNVIAAEDLEKLMGLGKKQKFDFLAKNLSIKGKANAMAFFTNTEVYDIVLNIIKARYSNPKLKILSGDGLYEEDKILKQPFEGMILAIPWFEKQENGDDKAFTKKAKKKWGAPISFDNAFAYDATKAFIKAISKSINPNRETVMRNLNSVQLLPNETSGDKLSFREGERKPVIVQVVKCNRYLQDEKFCFKLVSY